MSATEIVLYLSTAFISGWCLGFGVYSWRNFWDSF